MRDTYVGLLLGVYCLGDIECMMDQWLGYLTQDHENWPCQA